MTRSVSVLSVSDESVWAEIEALVPLGAYTERVLSPTQRVITPAFERDALPELRGRVLVRYARRDAVAVAAAQEDLALRIQGLSDSAVRVLHAAQRHARDGVVYGVHAWDPEGDAEAVRALFGAGLLSPTSNEEEAFTGSYRLHADLPTPAPVDYDFAEALMEETDDLSAPLTGPVGLLHDLASLAAALHHLAPKRTLRGSISHADTKRLGRRLGSAALAAGASLESDARWSLALRALEALRAITTSPIDRIVHLDPRVEDTLAGTAAAAVDRLTHRLVDRDQHVLLPAVRAALRQAGEGAVDELVFAELLAEQHREVIFPAWRRHGVAVYPALVDETLLPMDDDTFQRVEARILDRLLGRMVRLGLVRRATGVFAGTSDGRQWAGAIDAPTPPVWVSSDLTLIVPPHAVTPWERFQLERLGRCTARDVVDTYIIERASVVAWLATHPIDDAIGLLRRRCPGVPEGVQDALRAWADSAERVVLTRGVMLE